MGYDLATLRLLVKRTESCGGVEALLERLNRHAELSKLDKQVNLKRKELNSLDFEVERRKIELNKAIVTLMNAKNQKTLNNSRIMWSKYSTTF